jgi:protein-disulfide isomerase
MYTTVKRFLGVMLWLLFATLLEARPALPQSSTDIEQLKKEIEALKKGQEAIQRELGEIKGLLQGVRAPSPRAPENVVLNIEGAPYKGPENARLTLIEFSDYECPFCSRHFRQTMPRIEKDYVGTGKVKYVFLNFPIESIHPKALKAAEAANCSGEQGKYWEMHDLLFANQKALTPKDLLQYAQTLDLDIAKFQQCLGSGKQAERIRAEISAGRAAGISGTPTFFLGLTEPNSSKVKVLKVIKGAHPYTTFKSTMDSLLSSKK